MAEIDPERAEWCRSVGIAPEAVRNPAFPPDPITWEQWGQRRCDAEGITDLDQRKSRMVTIRQWRDRRDQPPPVAMVNPPRLRRGEAPAVYSQAEVDAWASEHAPQPEDSSTRVQELEAITTPQRLPDIARVLGLTPRVLRQERDLSLKRIGQGRPRSVEFPAPAHGHHGERDATYRPSEIADYWRARPGRGRRTGPNATPPG